MATRRKKTPARKAATRKGAARKGSGRKAGTRKGTAKKAAPQKGTGQKAAASKAKGEAAAPLTDDPTAMIRVLKEDGSVDTRYEPDLPDDTLRYLYRTMVQVREFDRRMLVLQRQGRIGFYGPILGQEAATVGSVAAMEDRDWIFPALREGAAAMMRGLPMVEALAQLIGTSQDRCKGRQMPCHYTLKEGNYYGMSSVIGTQISHATGAAMAARIRGDDVVVLGYMGDGATSANDFHCGMNFAAVYESPVVMLCQNNQWAISVPSSQQTASETFAVKAKAYGIPARRVDGNDVLAVYTVTKEAADRARRGEGPTFIEAVTYRRLGHSSSDDPTKYRDDDEVSRWERLDPVQRFRSYLESKGLWDDEQQGALEQEIADEVNAAIKEAESHGPPADDTLITDVFAEPTASMREMLDEVHNLQEEAEANDGAFPL